MFVVIPADRRVVSLFVMQIESVRNYSQKNDGAYAGAHFTTQIHHTLAVIKSYKKS